MDIAKEFYVAITVDRGRNTMTIASAEGGVEIAQKIALGSSMDHCFKHGTLPDLGEVKARKGAPRLIPQRPRRAQRQRFASLKIKSRHPRNMRHCPPCADDLRRALAPRAIKCRPGAVLHGLPEYPRAVSCQETRRAGKLPQNPYLRFVVQPLVFSR